MGGKLLSKLNQKGGVLEGRREGCTVRRAWQGGGRGICVPRPGHAWAPRAHSLRYCMGMKIVAHYNQGGGAALDKEQATRQSWQSIRSVACCALVDGTPCLPCSARRGDAFFLPCPSATLREVRLPPVHTLDPASPTPLFSPHSSLQQASRSHRPFTHACMRSLFPPARPQTLSCRRMVSEVPALPS